MNMVVLSDLVAQPRHINIRMLSQCCCNCLYHQVVEGGMVIIAAALLIAFEPVTGLFVEVFPDIGTPAVVLRFHIGFQQIEIIGCLYMGLCVIVQQVGHSCQRLCRSKRPYRPIPLTFAAAMCSEGRMAPVGGSNTKRGTKNVFIDQVFPGNAVGLGGQVEIPGNKANGFPHMGQRVALLFSYFKKFMATVP